MPDYGVVGPSEGTGLLPWSWAVERLSASRYYWVGTVGPDGSPHASAVWGIWHDDAVWFSCGGLSLKARNLDADPRCVVTTENPREPVIVEGLADRRSGRSDASRFSEHANPKYGGGYSIDFVAANALYAVRPTRIFGMIEDDFTGSPTRWIPRTSPG
ncbi:MAG: pyridoxamine 5'-phosphate oxidase family protein [Actinomycetota bacterium]|nr:pyridoxamine 5'-phosphate oxidase family protein [Actinomycetota bacterium]